MKTFVTFGFDHAHAVDGKTFDKDCVAVIHHVEPERGREIAFELFGPQFCVATPEEYFNFDSLDRYYDRGLINANDPLPPTGEAGK